MKMIVKLFDTCKYGLVMLYCTLLLMGVSNRWSWETLITGRISHTQYEAVPSAVFGDRNSLTVKYDYICTYFGVQFHVMNVTNRCCHGFSLN